MKNQIKKLVQEIIALCLDINSKGHHTFFKYYGHINDIEIEVHEHDYQSEIKYKKTAYTDFEIRGCEDENEVFQYYIEKLEEIKSDLKIILDWSKAE